MIDKHPTVEEMADIQNVNARYGQYCIFYRSPFLGLYYHDKSVESKTPVFKEIAVRSVKNYGFDRDALKALAQKLDRLHQKISEPTQSLYSSKNLDVFSNASDATVIHLNNETEATAIAIYAENRNYHSDQKIALDIISDLEDAKLEEINPDFTGLEIKFIPETNCAEITVEKNGSRVQISILNTKNYKEIAAQITRTLL